MNGKKGRDPRVEDLARHRREREWHGELARDALERTTDGAEPNVDRLLDKTREILDEAERRRGAVDEDALAASITLARWAVPRLAAAALLLVAVSATILFQQSGDTGDGFDRLDELVLGVDGDELTADQVFDTLFTPEG